MKAKVINKAFSADRGPTNADKERIKVNKAGTLLW